VADQVLSSLQNALLSVLVARAVSGSSFGAFGVAFATFSLTLEVSGAVGGQVLEVVFSPLRPRRSAAARAGVGSSLIVGLTVGAISVAVAAFCHGKLALVLIALGVSLPGLAVQDAWRTVAICSRTPQKGFNNDLLFLIVEIVGISVLILRHERSAAVYVLVWGASATAAALFGLRQFDCLPSIRAGGSFLRSHRNISVPGFVSAFLILGSIQLSLFAIGLVASLQSVGAVRGTQTLLGPMNIVGFAGVAFLVPELSSRALSPSRCYKAAGSLSGALLMINGLWGTLLLSLPGAAGRSLMGDSWVTVHHALPPMILTNCFVTLTTGPIAVIRALKRNRYLLYLGFLSAPLFAVLPALGAHLYGPAGATGGFAATAAAAVGPAWFFLRLAAAEGRQESNADGTSGRSEMLNKPPGTPAEGF
jgi:O-antigen/teichoic acid export membrane protein